MVQRRHKGNSYSHLYKYSVSSAVQGNSQSNISVSFILCRVVWYTDMDVSKDSPTSESLIDFSLLQILSVSFVKKLNWIEVGKMETIQEHGARLVL